MSRKRICTMKVRSQSIGQAFSSTCVDIYNIDTGARFSTYVIEAAAGSGIIGLNGAAARLAMGGDKVIIGAFAKFRDPEARSLQPPLVLLHEANQEIQA